MSDQFRSVLQLKKALKELKDARHFLHHKRVKPAEKETVDSLAYLGRALRIIQQEFGTTVTTFNYTGSLQTFTAPSDGTVKIQAIGAAGGGVESEFGETVDSGALGASIQGDYPIIRGTTLAILVGGAGGQSRSSGGGGGGSFVWVGTTFSDLTQTSLLVSAGGGGGTTAASGGAGVNAVLFANGASSTDGAPGGSEGNGGSAGSVFFGAGGGGGGAGVFTNGGTSGGLEGGTGGTAINSGGSGGNGSHTSASGGFGGGGGGGGGAGGGGGYSGGGGGGAAKGGGGGGGGSFSKIGAAVVAAPGVGNGNGTVTITFVPLTLTLNITQTAPFTFELTGNVAVSGVPLQGIPVTFTFFVGPRTASLNPNPAITDASGNYAATLNVSNNEPQFFSVSYVDASTMFNGITISVRQFIETLL